MTIQSILPQEVLINIFSQLDTLSLTKAEQACKIWRMLGSDNQVWKNVFQANPYFEEVKDKPTRNWKQTYIIQHRIVCNLQKRLIGEWIFTLPSPSLGRVKRWESYFRNIGGLPCFLKNNQFFEIKDCRFDRIAAFNPYNRTIRVYSRTKLLNEFTLPKIEDVITKFNIKHIEVLDKQYLAVTLEGVITKSKKAGYAILAVPYSKDSSATMKQIPLSPTKFFFMHHPSHGSFVSLSNDEKTAEVLDIHQLCNSKSVATLLLTTPSKIESLFSCKEGIVTFHKDRILSWMSKPGPTKFCYEVQNFEDFGAIISNEKLILFEKRDAVDLWIGIYDINVNKTIKGITIKNGVKKIDASYTCYAHRHLFLASIKENLISVINIDSLSEYCFSLPRSFHSEKLKSLTFHDGQLIAVNQNGNLRVWDWNQGQTEKEVGNRIPLELVINPPK